MLKKFVLKNYKNFKDEISINFKNTAGYQFSTDCITDGIISKMLIYGRNATGKTNLGKALIDIRVIMFSSPYMGEEEFLNADSMENSAMFSYEFEFDNRILIYKYERFSNQELKSEELIIDGNTIFKCNFENGEFEFDNLHYINAETANIQRYLQSLNIGGEVEEIQEPKLPFLRWLISNVALSNNSLLIKLSSYVRRMIRITAVTGMLQRPRQLNESFYEFLENQNKLKDLEDFLNEMGVECKLVLKKLPDGRKELYFSHEKLVPFYETASSGTLALVDLYRRLIPKGWEPSFIYLDEFDAFYHYEMAEKVISFFKRKYPKCQIIMTSHNTNLMTNRLMRPDCLFILSRSGTLTALCNATSRELREGHNLEKMYISGEFEKYE
ncbi:AAA family ATPase [Velocimicrobium porci]|uniref:ATP-binding protein n=1 Tax=Velocimicrobium porci TaxID=2606634 RepID=A0A6L5Y0C6_9FIRM|nr:ATP-binding protein [Velocimicrobium porci]MSS64515.1 ATP-binding protein [Velocimicrobium porci]